MGSDQTPRVFISYSHDSSAHEEQVLALAQRLRQDGIDAWLDRLVVSPDQGWLRWMQDEIERADFVLAVCTAIYSRRFEGHEEPGRGLGVNWEGFLTAQLLYEQAAINKKCIPVLFGDELEKSVPLVLRPVTRYRLDDDYEGLLRRLTNQPEVVPVPLGTVPHLPSRGAEAMGPAVRRASLGPLPVRSHGAAGLGRQVSLARNLRIFVIYAPQDESLCLELEQHLKAATTPQEPMAVWHRGKVMAGANVDAECTQQRSTAEILLLLLSANLVGKHRQELEEALAERERGARVIPILLRPVHLVGPIADLKILPTNRRAIVKHADRDTAWGNVVQEVLRATGELRCSLVLSSVPDSSSVSSLNSVNGVGVPRASAEPFKHRILVLIAEPQSAGRIEAGQEVKAIRRSVARNHDRFAHIVEVGVEPIDLQNSLKEYRPHILHFTGHASRDGRLIFEDGQGNAKPVDMILLARLFRAHNAAHEEADRLRCVVLNASYTGDATAAALFEDVDCILAVLGTIHNKTALAFAEGFYTAITAGHSVEAATENARLQAHLQGAPNPDALKLFTRPGLDAATLRFV